MSNMYPGDNIAGIASQTPFGGTPYTPGFMQTHSNIDKTTADAIGYKPFATPMKTRTTQTFLAKQGYKVSIDGIAGPQTTSALNDYLAGKGPTTWNSKWQSQHGGTSRTDRTPAVTPPHDPAFNPTGAPAPARTNPIGRPGGRTPTGAGGSPLQAMLDRILGNQHFIDPKAYASEIANAQFDPRINSLVNSMTQSKSNLGVQQKDLQNWYSELVHEATAAAAASLGDQQALIGSAGAASKGIIDAFGGSANPAGASLGAMGTAGTGELAQIGLGDVNNLRAEGLSYARQGVGMQTKALRDYNTQLQTDLASLSDLRGQKGNAYATALSQGWDQYNNQKKNAFNEGLSAALAGPQLKSAQQGVIRNQQAIRAANQSYAVDQWRFKMGIKQAKQGGNAGSVPKFEQQDPTKLANYLQTGVLGPRGNLNQSPVDVYNKMTSMLKTISFGKWDPDVNPSVKNFIIGLVNSHLSAWNRQNPQNPYHFAGGRLVKGR